MTSWLQVPAPRGDLGEIRQAAVGLRRCSQHTRRGAEQLSALEGSLDGLWRGEAGDAFRVKTAAARLAILSVAEVEEHATRLLQDYAREWNAAQDASVRARRDIEAAVETYVRAAPSALQGVVAQLGGFVEGAMQAMDQLAGRLGDIQQAVYRMSSWSPPASRPAFVIVEARQRPGAVSFDEVLRGLHAGGEWGVSHLLDGAKGVAQLVGGALDGAMKVVHAVEQAFAAAVASALRLAYDALEALQQAAQRAVAAVRYLVTDLGTKVFQAVAEAVNTGRQFLVAVGVGLVRTAHVVEDVALAAAGVTGALSRIGWDERRMQNPTAADNAATLRFYSDPKEQIRVDARRMLSDSFTEGNRLPSGWTRLGPPIHGAEGFDAAVFRNPSTGEIVVAFSGSREAEDWLQDSQNAGAMSTSQGAQAIALAQSVVAANPGATVSFTGHSLGGSLAAIASIATGGDAITFNAAGVGEGNYQAAVRAGHGVGASEEQITNFRTTNDILSVGQQGLRLTPAAGAQVVVASNTDNPVGAHSLKNFDWSGLQPAAGS